MRKFLSENKSAIVIAGIMMLASVSLFTPAVHPFFGKVKSSILDVLTIPIKVCSKISVSFRGKYSLAAENRDLRKMIGDLSLEISRFGMLGEENERLRDLLKFKKTIKFDTVSAEILARNPNDWIGSFIIDKGTAEGVHKNSAVCSAKGLLGKVVDAGENTSSVMLITHPGFKAGGTLQRTMTTGIVAGSGDGSVRMLYLPVDTDVREGDMVFTSGFSRIFPKGVAIGKIVSSKISGSGLYKEAVIEPSANISGQEEVLCVR
ncbi:MAG: rod shape-determining protein MreC [Candidatus Omnitrophota bacterium]